MSESFTFTGDNYYSESRVEGPGVDIRLRKDNPSEAIGLALVEILKSNKVLLDEIKSVRAELAFVKDEIEIMKKDVAYIWNKTN